MIHMVDPRQNRLFDPFQGVIPLPVNGSSPRVGRGSSACPPGSDARWRIRPRFGRELGAHQGTVLDGRPASSWPTSSAGPPKRPSRFTSSGATSSRPQPRAASRSRLVASNADQKMFRDDELAISVFQDVTTRLAEKLELDITCQRLDSTHIFSHMASFGRTKLMAVAIRAVPHPGQASRPRVVHRGAYLRSSAAARAGGVATVLRCQGRRIATTLAAAGG